MKRDYYETLGLQKNASADEIKKAYRQMAVKCHPDKNQGDKKSEEKFREITEAYETLKDPQKRHKYDNPAIDISNIFSSFSFNNNFRQHFTHARGRAGADLQMKIELSFQEILHGTNKTIKYKRYEKCDSCSGKGGERITCNSCKGSGYTEISRQTNLFQVRRQAVCLDCNGIGTKIGNLCNICHGESRLLRDTKVKVKIPAGTPSNQDIVVRHHGHCGKNNGVPGHLRIRCLEQPDDFFTRSNDDIVCNANITISQAVLGDSTKMIKTLEGTEKIDIKKGTKHGEIIKLKNMGLPNIKTGKRGSQIICFTIDMPKDLTKEQIKLFTKLKEQGL